MPDPSRRPKISGMLSSVIQWIWKHWRVVQSMTPRPKSSAIEAIVSACAGAQLALDDLDAHHEVPVVVLCA